MIDFFNVVICVQKTRQYASLFLLSFRLVYKLLSPFFELCVKSVKQFTVYFLSTKNTAITQKYFCAIAVFFISTTFFEPLNQYVND